MSEQPRPRKAVIPAAGLGTRFLPATKAIPKELLPVVDVPALEYIVAEAAGVGLTDVLVITSRGKEAIADHFDRAPEIEAALEKKGDAERLAAVRRSADLANMHYVRQGNPRGLGHAILMAEAFVGDEPFAVLLGDDIVDERDELLQPMLDVQAEFGGCVVALMEVPRHSVSLYGCVAAEPTGREGVVKVTDLVEKPSPDDAPSNLAIIGRYVLAPSIFQTLHNTAPGRGNEIQITDALREQATAGQPMHGVVFRGRRYDTGDKADYLKAVVRLACDRPDLGPEFRQWLEDFVAGRA
jgi:UTP--glucose-1-phosphate uridylyltransferase